MKVPFPPLGLRSERQTLHRKIFLKLILYGLKNGIAEFLLGCRLGLFNKRQLKYQNLLKNDLPADPLIPPLLPVSLIQNKVRYLLEVDSSLGNFIKWHLCRYEVMVTDFSENSMFFSLAI